MLVCRCYIPRGNVEKQKELNQEPESRKRLFYSALSLQHKLAMPFAMSTFVRQLVLRYDEGNTLAYLATHWYTAVAAIVAAAAAAAVVPCAGSYLFT